MKNILFLAALASSATLFAANTNNSDNSGNYQSSGNKYSQDNQRYDKYDGQTENNGNYRPQRNNRTNNWADSTDDSNNGSSRGRNSNSSRGNDSNRSSSPDYYAANYGNGNSSYQVRNNYLSNSNATSSEMQTSSNLVSDKVISNQIKNIIKPGYLSPGYESVSFQVNNGDVTIQGIVATPSDKEKIEKDIKAIKGVRNLKNLIMLKTQKVAQMYSKQRNQVALNPGIANKNPNQSLIENSQNSDLSQTELDRQLNVKIRHFLENGPVAEKIAYIILDTNNGDVTLTGKVKKMDDINVIIAEVKQVNGVNKVINQMTAQGK